MRDTAVTTAGYNGTPVPNQWFGGPELTTHTPFFDRTAARREGSMVLRDASGFVVDSLNYGLLADPWAAEGYQGISGAEESGCHVPTPGAEMSFGPAAESANATNTSAGRFPDGADTDSNCADFVKQAAATLSLASGEGATNLKVSSVNGFIAGQKIMIDTGVNGETATIANVGTAGATTIATAIDAGATVISVAGANGFQDDQAITIGSGGDTETATIASVRRFGANAITVTAPLTHAHAVGAQVSGTGIALSAALTLAHASGAQVTDNVPTPGAPNRYSTKQH